jgi:MFS family permease
VKSVLRIRDFRLLFTGEGVSLLGDQFYFIALPWLVLELTGSAVVLGLVLALQGIPRAAFMLIGGAVTDRFSPRRVMIASNVARLSLVTLLAALVLGGALQMWMLFVVAAAYGVADGFFYPAQSAIVPQLASLDQLSVANAFVQGLDQVSQFIGPVLAGILIASAVGGHGGLEGVGIALVVDAATFVVSIILLSLMRVDADKAARMAVIGAEGNTGAAPAGIWESIREGLAYMWSDPLLRVLLLLILAVNFLAVGPMLVGVPALAHQRLAGGAQDYGAVMSAFGGGSLAGLAVAGGMRRPPARLMGHLLLTVCAVFGAGLAMLGFAHSLAAALVPAAVMGFAAGYLTVSFFTWVQARTPQRLMGRMMSFIIFASVGLVPVSQALSGAVASRSLTALFVGAAALLLLVVARAWFVPSLRSMGMEMAAESPGAPSAVSDGHQDDADEHERSAEPLRHRE